MTAQYLIHMVEKETYLQDLGDLSSTIKAMQNTHKNFGIDIQIPEARVRSLVHSKFSKTIYVGTHLLYNYFADREASRKLGSRNESLELKDIWQAGDPFDFLGFRSTKKTIEYVKFQKLLVRFLEVLVSPEVKRLSLIYRKSFGEGFDKEQVAIQNLLNHINQVVRLSFPEIFESNGPALNSENYENDAFLQLFYSAIKNPLG